MFWPCPTLDHPGTPRLFEGSRFFHADGKARFVTTEYRESGDPTNAEFPVYLTTGRVVSQYLSGTQTRRIGALVDQSPNTPCGNSSSFGRESGHQAERLGYRNDSPPGDHFAGLGCEDHSPRYGLHPYHWPGQQSANQLTHRTLDPRSKIPEFKVSACRIRKCAEPPEWAKAGNRDSLRDSAFQS